MSKTPILGCHSHHGVSWIKRTLFNFACPKDWNSLTTTDDPSKRFCTSCGEHVYLIAHLGDMAAAGRRCIALNAADGQGLPVRLMGSLRARI